MRVDSLPPSFGNQGALFVDKPKSRRLERFFEGASHLQDAAWGGAVVFGGFGAIGVGMYLPPATWMVAGLAGLGLATFSGVTHAFNRAVAARDDTVASPFHCLSFVGGIVLPLALSVGGVFGIQQAFNASSYAPPSTLSRVVTCVEGQKPPVPASLILLKRRGVKVINCPGALP